MLAGMRRPPARKPPFFTARGRALVVAAYSIEGDNIDGGPKLARTVEDIDREIEQLKARRKAIVAKQGAAERKRRNHALMTAGGLLASCFAGGWASIDYGRLAAYLKRHGEEIASECAAEPLPSEDAYRRLRDWERAGRQAVKEDARPAVDWADLFNA